MASPRRWWRRGGWLGVGLLAAWLGIRPALSAERIFFAVGPLLQSISISSLEAFALEGRLTGELARYAPFISEAQLTEFRAVLTQSYEIDPLAIGDLAYTPLGSTFLERLGNIFQTASGQNGLRAIRASLISTAQSREGFTVLGFLQNFPTDMRLNTREALFFVQALRVFREYQASALVAIATQSQQEAASQNPGQLPLLGAGSVAYQRQQITVPATASPQESFPVDLYLPQTATPLPTVIISSDQNATALADHLAAYGIAVAVLRPVPNEGQRNPSLEGLQSANLEPADLLSRPREITAALDYLETWDSSEAAFELDLERVGVVGTYLGGYAALTTAGADLNRSRLERLCGAQEYVLNLSLLLQCRALELPKTSPELSDPRVGAVVAINPLTSVLLGPESMGQLEVPVMLISSSNFLTPVVSEHVHPFVWLQSPTKRLALKVPSQQLTSPPAGGVLPNSLNVSHSDLSDTYDQTLTLAFMQTHIASQPDYAPYLSAAYGQAISQEPLSLLLLQTLTEEQLEAAYGEAIPADVLPEISSR